MMNEIERVVVDTPQTVLDEFVRGAKAVKELCESHFQRNKTDREWLSSEEVRETLGVSAKIWQKYRDGGRIPFSQFGGRIYVKRSDLGGFTNSHCIK